MATITGTNVNDTLTGTTGDDVFVLGGAVYVINGNGGIDTIDAHNAPTAVNINLVAGTMSGWGSATLNGITQIYGGYNGGTLVANNATTYIAAPGGDTNITGGASSEIIVLGSGNNTVHAGAGNDQIYVNGNGSNTIDGEAGYNGVSYQNTSGFVKVDLYSGAWHTGIMDTLTNIVNITGGNFGNELYGDWQDNIIVGGAAADKIEGREGSDTLTGGGGADTFIMDPTYGNVVITDFSHAQGDVIDLSHLGRFASLQDVLAHSTQVGSDTVIDLVASSSSAVGHLTLRGVAMTSLTASDFGVPSASGSSVGPGKGGSPTTGSGALNGGAGDDWLQGQGGNDTLHGGAGSDYLDGGAGLDTATYDGVYRQYVVASGAATVTGGPEGGSDSLVNIERVQFVDGYLALSPTDTAGQVYRVYAATLDRTPDPVGFANWTHSLNSGTSLKTMVDGFVGSNEFQAKYGALDNTAFVTLLYKNVLHRDPDASGLNNWITYLNQGHSRSEVVLGFSESQEDIAALSAPVQQGLWVGDAAAAQAARLYDTVLGRLPDASGLANWTHSLNTGTTLLQATQGFVGSAEFQSVYGNLDNSQFVQLLYRNTLHREADASGLSNWVSFLNSGHSRAEVVLGFSESQEHMANTAAHIDYGIWVA